MSLCDLAVHIHCAAGGVPSDEGKDEQGVRSRARDMSKPEVRAERADNVVEENKEGSADDDVLGCHHGLYGGGRRN